MNPPDTPDFFDFIGFSFASLVEHLYDYGMLNATVTNFLDAIAHLDVHVDGDEISAILRGCEDAVAKTMDPLRAFDELKLYQLSKADSTAQFLERCAGLSPAEARASVILARKLEAMPLTEAAWLAGTITSGQVRAIAAIVTKRLAERYRDDEADVLGIVKPLDAKDTDLALQRWANYTEASLDDNPDKAPREDEFFHSESSGRYFSKGSFGKVTGAVIDKAIELAETDNPRDNDTRSPAQRRGEALGDVCGFYLNYMHRITTDPDADAPVVPKKRNQPHLIAVSQTNEMGNRGGAQLLNGPHIDHHAFEALSAATR
jgi:uncharacterized protein DUF222